MKETNAPPEGGPAGKPQSEAHDSGVQCQRCGCRHLPVYYSRRCRGFTLRVRVCRNCGQRLTTRETII